MTIFGLSVEPVSLLRSGMRILIVEDERKTSSFIRKALQAEGYAVDVLHRGDEGLAAALITLAKPFELGELVARVRAICRRGQGASAPYRTGVGYVMKEPQ